MGNSKCPTMIVPMSQRYPFQGIQRLSIILISCQAMNYKPAITFLNAIIKSIIEYAGPLLYLCGLQLAILNGDEGDCSG